MSDTTRMIVNVSYTYDVNNEAMVDHYDTTDPDEAAKVDESNYLRMPYLIGEDLDSGVDNLVITVTAEPREL